MTDPKQWIDPASKISAEMRALLRAARTELPEDQRVEEIGSRVGPGLGAPTVGSPTPGPTVGAAGAGAASAGIKLATAVKVAIVAVVTVGTTAGAYVETRAARPVGAAIVPADVPRPRRLQPAPPLPAPIEPTVEPVPVAPTATAAPAATASAHADENEISILEDSEDALQSNPGRALAQVERHAARYPHGALAQEREVIAIEALLRLGRSDEAHLRAARFERDYPRSAHLPRIEALMAEDAFSHNP
jgi:hypothetical protein